MKRIPRWVFFAVVPVGLAGGFLAGIWFYVYCPGAKPKEAQPDAPGQVGDSAVGVQKPVGKTPKHDYAPDHRHDHAARA